MRSSETLTLPLTLEQYELQNEQLTRRTIEQALSDLRSDLIEVRDLSAKPASLSMRKSQFLLMGAS